MMTDKYQNNKPSSNRLFDFLDDLDEEQIYYLLKTEKETVMALAIDQVSESQRNAFLSQLVPETRNMVIKELGSLKSIPLEMVVSIAHELEKKASFLPEPKIFSRGGIHLLIKKQVSAFQILRFWLRLLILTILKLKTGVIIKDL